MFMPYIVCSTLYGKMINTLFTYEHTKVIYDGRRLINKHVMYNFSLDISSYHVRRSCLAQTRKRTQVTRTRAYQTHALVPHKPFYHMITIFSFSFFLWWNEAEPGPYRGVRVSSIFC